MCCVVAHLHCALPRETRGSLALTESGHLCHQHSHSASAFNNPFGLQRFPAFRFRTHDRNSPSDTITETHRS
ncbi:hypothetical protein Mapa_006795 [Marchantia paleacea]|nr:hypothetical protein Mapa_006795 [Marchantia paleacea]